jgi:hypothetical protein
MPTRVKLDIHKGHDPVEVDLDTLTPKARALAEAISMSFGHQPLGVLVNTGRTKGDNRNHAYLHGTGPAADAIGAEPDLRFVTNWALIPAESPTTAARWLEENARSIPVDSWPIAGAASRMEPLTDRVPSADAAREDRCLTPDQVHRYLADQGERSITISRDAWIMLQKAGNAPAPRHYAAGGLMPLWHVDDLDAYLARDFERWPISRVADELGYTGPSATGSARKTMSRWGLYPVGRAAGRGGETVYAADQIQAAQSARPGKGRRGAAREGGKFAAPDTAPY